MKLDTQTLPVCDVRDCLFGADCAVCSDGHTEKLSFTCTKCSDGASGVAVVVLLVLAAVIVAVAVVSYVMSGESGGKGRGLVERVARYVPLQSVKIVIVSWQILTQVRAIDSDVRCCVEWQAVLGTPQVLGSSILWFKAATRMITPRRTRPYILPSSSVLYFLETDRLDNLPESF